MDRSDQSPLGRRRSAAMAGHLGDHRSARAGTCDADPAVRAAALRSMQHLCDLDAATLAAALSDPAPPVRMAALELAARRPEIDVRAALDDRDALVVEQAAWCCGERPDDHRPVRRLAELAGVHDDPLVRESAVAALGAIGCDQGRAAILAAFSDKPAVRRRAVIALAAFEGPDVDAAFERARADRDRQVRDAVDELLGPAES